LEKISWYVDDNEVNEENTLLFLEAWKAGKWPKFYKSDEINQVLGTGDVETTSGNIFRQTIAGNKDQVAFLMIYNSSGCDICKNI
jgi:hypothetical protein